MRRQRELVQGFVVRYDGPSTTFGFAQTFDGRDVYFKIANCRYVKTTGAESSLGSQRAPVPPDFSLGKRVLMDVWPSERGLFAERWGVVPGMSVAEDAARLTGQLTEKVLEGFLGLYVQILETWPRRAPEQRSGILEELELGLDFLALKMSDVQTFVGSVRAKTTALDARFEHSLKVGARGEDLGGHQYKITIANGGGTIEITLGMTKRPTTP